MRLVFLICSFFTLTAFQPLPAPNSQALHCPPKPRLVATEEKNGGFSLNITCPDNYVPFVVPAVLKKYRDTPNKTYAKSINVYTDAICKPIP